MDGLDSSDERQTLSLLDKPDVIVRDEGSEYVRFEFGVDVLIERFLRSDKESGYFNLPKSLLQEANNLMLDLKNGKDVEAGARAAMHNIFARVAKSVHVKVEVKETGVESPIAKIDLIGLEMNDMWV